MTRELRLYGRLRGHVTHAPVAERLAVKLPGPDFNDLGLLRPEIEPQFPTKFRGERSASCFAVGKRY